MFNFSHDFSVIHDCNSLTNWSGNLLLSDCTTNAIENTSIKLEWQELGLNQEYALLSLPSSYNLENKILAFWLYSSENNKNIQVTVRLEDTNGNQKDYQLINLCENSNYSKNYYPNSFGQYWNFIKIYCISNPDIDLTQINKIYFIFTEFNEYFLIDYIVYGRKYLIESDEQVRFEDIHLEQQNHYLHFLDYCWEKINNNLINSQRIYCDIFFGNENQCIFKEEYLNVKGKFYLLLKGQSESKKCIVEIKNSIFEDLNYEYFPNDYNVISNYSELNLNNFILKHTNFNHFCGNKQLTINALNISINSLDLYPNSNSNFNKCYFRIPINLAGDGNNLTLICGFKLNGTNNLNLIDSCFNGEIELNNNFNGTIIIKNTDILNPLYKNQINIIKDATNHNGSINRYFDLEFDIKGKYWKEKEEKDKFEKSYEYLENIRIKIFDKSNNEIYNQIHSISKGKIEDILIEEINITDSTITQVVKNPLVIEIYDKYNVLIFRKNFYLNEKDYKITEEIDINPETKESLLEIKPKTHFERKFFVPSGFKSVSKLKNSNYYLILDTDNRIWCLDKNKNLLFYNNKLEKNAIKICGFKGKYNYVFLTYEDLTSDYLIYAGSQYIDKIQLNFNGIIQEILEFSERNPKTYLLEKIFYLVILKNKDIYMRKIIENDKYLNFDVEILKMSLPDDVEESKVETSEGMIFIKTKD